MNQSNQLAMKAAEGSLVTYPANSCRFELLTSAHRQADFELLASARGRADFELRDHYYINMRNIFTLKYYT